jgi:hypothetical protein
MDHMMGMRPMNAAATVMAFGRPFHRPVNDRLVDNGGRVLDLVLPEGSLEATYREDLRGVWWPSPGPPGAMAATSLFSRSPTSAGRTDGPGEMAVWIPSKPRRRAAKDVGFVPGLPAVNRAKAHGFRETAHVVDSIRA